MYFTQSDRNSNTYLKKMCKTDISILNITTTVYFSFYVFYTTGLKMTLWGQNKLPI
jgi:hypothetical protein